MSDEDCGEGCTRHETCRNPRVYQQNPDGSRSPAKPLGWMEEHNLWQRFLFWLTRTPHCNDEAHRRLIARQGGNSDVR